MKAINSDYQIFFQEAPDPYLVVDTDKAKILDCNIAAEKILGGDRTQIIGLTIVDISPSYQANGELTHVMVQKNIQRLLEEHEASLDWIHERLDGGIFYADVNIKVVTHHEQPIMLVTWRNLSRFKKIIAAQEQRYHLVVESLPQLIWTCLPDGKCDYLSPQWQNYTGKPSDEQLGFAWLEAIHPDDQQQTIDSWMQSAKTGKRLEIEFRIQRYDGIYHWFHTLAIPLRDELGNIVKWYGTNTDIDKLKNAELNLKLAASVFSCVMDAIIILGDDYSVIKVNPALERILGYNQREIIGKNFKDLRPYKHVSSPYDELWQKAIDNGASQGEVWQRHKNGNVIPVWMSITVLHDDKNNIFRFVVLLYDMTQQKISTERLRYLANYDALTELPNRHLLMDRLKHAVEQAKRTSSMIAIFFIDIDRFKHINDTYGHMIGDHVLCEIATRLRTTIRESDTLGRLGGDELLMLLEHVISKQVLITIASNLLGLFEPTITVSGLSLHVTASIGIACYPNDGDTLDLLMLHADSAMYAAKAAGRNQFRFFADLE